VSDETRSVLGRYGEPAGDSELVEVRLRNFPLQLFAQAREHHDELMREFSLLAMSPPENRPGHAVPARLLDLIDQLGRRYGASGERSDAIREAAIERGEIAMDLTYRLPRSAGAAINTLHDLMEAADEFCQSEQLLTLASTPAERDFRVWFLDQFTCQLAGGDPVPWNGPMTNEDTPPAV